MPREIETLPQLRVTNPDRNWVSQQIDSLIAEWRAWGEVGDQLVAGPDSPEYDPNTCSEAIKDGRENIQKHEVLREKTLIFLRNHFEGSEFLFRNWSHYPYENGQSRIAGRVPTWVHRLEVMKASMGYVLVPEGYWQGQAKRFLERLSESTAEGAVEVAKSFLKNPMG